METITEFGATQIGNMDHEEGSHERSGVPRNVDMAKDGESAEWNS